MNFMNLKLKKKDHKVLGPLKLHELYQRSELYEHFIKFSKFIRFITFDLRGFVDAGRRGRHQQILYGRWGGCLGIVKEAPADQRGFVDSGRRGASVNKSSLIGGTVG